MLPSGGHISAGKLGSASWGSLTQKDHWEKSSGEASTCEGAWPVQGAKGRLPCIGKKKGAEGERRGGAGGMCVQGTPLECFMRRSGMTGFTWCYNLKGELKLKWKNCKSQTKKSSRHVLA